MRKFHSAPRWEPPLVQRDREHALAVVEAIAEIFSRYLEGDQLGFEDDPVLRRSLYRGWPGIALFLGLCADELQNSRYRRAATKALLRTIRAVRSEGADPSIGGGLAGIALAIELSGSSNTELKLAKDQIDASLQRLMEAKTGLPLEVTVGLCGIAAYFHTKRASPNRSRALILVQSKLVADYPAGWSLAPPFLSGTPEFSTTRDFGMAHGLGGLLATVGILFQTTNANRRLSAIAKDSLSTILSFRLSADMPFSFPCYLTEGKSPHPYKVAWCYGDLGMGLALSHLHRSGRFGDLSGVARETWSRAAAYEPADSGVQSIGLCHGTAGLGHILNRAYRMYGQHDVKAASQKWLVRTLASADEWTRRVKSNTTPLTSLSSQDDISFIDGIAGAGLTLLAAASRKSPRWDAVLLCS